MLSGGGRPAPPEPAEFIIETAADAHLLLILEVQKAGSPGPGVGRRGTMIQNLHAAKECGRAVPQIQTGSDPQTGSQNIQGIAEAAASGAEVEGFEMGPRPCFILLLTIRPHLHGEDRRNPELLPSLAGRTIKRM
jgi:hypothetical protein